MELLKEFAPKEKFIPVDVYKNDSYKGCAGITEELKTIYIPCEEGHVSYENIKSPELTVFTEEHRGGEYWALKPILKTQYGFSGPMFGGNLAYSSDSRCKRVYFIHDRYEVYMG